MKKTKILKRLVSVSLAAIMATSLLAGCGSKEKSNSNDVSKNESKLETSDVTETKGGLPDSIEPTEIVFWHAMSGSNGEAMDQLVADYNDTVGKENGIKVVSVFQDRTIASKVLMVGQDNDLANAPDVIQTVGSDIPSLTTLSQVFNAENYINDKNSKISTDDYYENMLRTFTYKDELIGVPMNTSSILLYYNEDLLKAAGYDAPPATIEELAEYTEKLTVKEGDQIKQYGLNVQISRYQLVNFLASQYPESYIGDNEGGRKAPMTKTTIGEDGTLEKFLTEWEKVVQSGGYKHIEDNANEEFATGVNAMTILSSSRLGAITKLVGDNFSFKAAPLPKVSADDTSGASVGGSCLMMFNRDDENKLAAAWNFIEYATSAEVQAKWSQATGYMPTNQGVEKLDTMIKFYEENPQFLVPIEQMKASSPLSQEPFDLVNWEIDGIIKDIMQEFGAGELTVEEAADEIVTQYNNALDEYHRANS